MITVNRPASQSRSTYRFDLLFSERRLLLLFGDLVVILGSGAVAFWFHWLLS